MVLWSYGTIGNNYETYSIEEWNPKLFSQVFNLTEIPISFIDFSSSAKDAKEKKYYHLQGWCIILLHIMDMKKSII